MPLDPGTGPDDSLDARLALFEIDDTDAARLRDLHEALEGRREALVDGFYAFLQGVPAMARLLPSGPALERLKDAQARYFESLTHGRYDEAYARERTAIGRAHQRVGLKPQWYLAAYRKYVSLVLAAARGPAGLAEPRFLDIADSLLKAVSLDTLLALDAYFEQASLEKAAGLERYRMVFEMAPLGIAHAGADRRVLAANERLAEIVGARRGSLEGRLVDALVHPEELEAAQSALQSLIDGSEGTHSAVYRLLRADGGPCWARMSGALSRDEATGERFLVLMFDDLTEQRRVAAELERSRVHARLALQDSELRYRSLFESSGDAIVLVEDGMVVDCNRSAEVLLVAASEEILGSPFLGLLMARLADRARHGESVANALARTAPGRPQRLDVRLAVGGREIDADVRFNSVELSGATYVQAILRDDSERQAAERALHQLNATLEARIEERTAALRFANRELEAFSYSVSHDLRAPLRTIHGFSRLLEEDLGPALGEEARDHLERVKGASLRMDRMLSDLLQLARLSRVALRRERTDLTGVAQEVAAELRALDDRPADIRIAPGLVADADPGLLRNVLENLMSNAWKYSAGREVTRIEVGALDTARGRAFFIGDNGVGFDMAHAGKLFGVFERLHHEHEFPGEGVGLATVQRIVQRHGGDVWAEAAPDRGATFYFTLGGGSSVA